VCHVIFLPRPGGAKPRVTSLAAAEVRKVHAVRHPRWKLHSWKCHDGLLRAPQKKKWRKIPPRERRRGIRLSRDGESRERRTAGFARLAPAKGISAAAPSRVCGIFHGARFHVRFNIKTTARKVSLPPSRFPPPLSPTPVRGCLPLSLLSRALVRLALTHASGWFRARARTREMQLGTRNMLQFILIDRCAQRSQQIERNFTVPWS